MLPGTIPRRIAATRRLLATWRGIHGHWPRLHAPRGFNEWVLRRMLFERRPLYRTLCDKLALRDFARARLGADMTPPVLATASSGAGIPWDSLPRAVILKANHGSGWNVALADTASADREAIAARFDAWIAQDYADTWQEWGYRGLVPRILAEPLLAAPGFASPPDVRVYVFGGVPRLIRMRWIETDGTVSGRYFDPATRPLPIRHPLRDADHPFPDVDPGPILRMAARLADGLDFLRVDFLHAEGRWWLGETTLYPAAALERFDPPEWEAWCGALWRAARRGEAPPAQPG